MTVERQITINVPPEQVFAYVSDLSRHPEWAGHDLKIEKTSEGPAAAVGATFSSVGHLMGEHKGQVRVTELQPNTSVVYEAEDDTGHFRHYFRLEPADGGTRVTKGSDPQRLSLMLKLLMPVGRLYMVPKGLDGDLQRIKAKLEGIPSEPPATASAE